MNEVADIEVKFQPAIIEVEDREQFEKYINQVVTQYKDYEVSAETLKDDKATRALLRKLATKLDDRRKDIKREFNQPLSELETWIKKAVKPLNDTISKIDLSIKALEEQEKSIRTEVIHGEIEKLTTDAEIDPRIFDSMIDDWAKVANFSKDFKPKKSLIDDISFVVDREKQKIDQFKALSANISDFAFGNGMSATPYIRMLKDGKEISEIMHAMTEDVLYEKQRKEAEEKRKAELAAKQEQEQKDRQELASKQLERDFGLDSTNPDSDSTHIGINSTEAPSINAQPAPTAQPEFVYHAVINVEFDLKFGDIEAKNEWKKDIERAGGKIVKVPVWEKIKP